MSSSKANCTVTARCATPTTTSGHTSTALASVKSAIPIAVGAPILDPIIGLGMTAVILRITRASWRTVRGHTH
jgi:hypothetical protein